MDEDGHMQLRTSSALKESKYKHFILDKETAGRFQEVVSDYIQQDGKQE